jgi:hypothetical protein
MTREEVRDLEDMPYIGELGFLETPNNNGLPDRSGGARAALPSLTDARTDITVNDAPTTLRLDSVTVSEDAQRQMLQANEQAWQAIDTGWQERDGALVDAFTVVAEQLREQAKRAELADQRAAAIEARLEAAEEREAERLLPITRETIDTDEAGRPTIIRMRQGDRTWRKVIERDGPRVVNVREIAS